MRIYRRDILEGISLFLLEGGSCYSYYSYYSYYSNNSGYREGYNHYFFLSKRKSSPIQSTNEVAPMMMSHVVSGNGSTLKNIPPKLTINT